MNSAVSDQESLTLGYYWRSTKNRDEYGFWNSKMISNRMYYGRADALLIAQWSKTNG